MVLAVDHDIAGRRVEIKAAIVLPPIAGDGLVPYFSNENPRLRGRAQLRLPPPLDLITT